MNEHPDQYSRQHPGHSEPDRYLDDEGRCTFCGRSVWEENAKMLERQLAEAKALAERRGSALNWLYGNVVGDDLREYIRAALAELTNR